MDLDQAISYVKGEQGTNQSIYIYLFQIIILNNFSDITMAAAAEQVSPNENLQTTDASVTQKKKLQRSSSNKKSLALAKQMLSAKEKALEKRDACANAVVVPFAAVHDILEFRSRKVSRIWIS